MLITIIALLAGNAFAVPMELNHQGRLMDTASGLPLQGNHDIGLTLYDSPAGGNVLWTETTSTGFTEGYYAVVLGTDPTNPLDDAVFAGNNAFLAMSVDGAAELPGRQSVVSVPYAFLANTATNVDGGVVNATEIQINGSTVIDASGSFLGAADGDTLAALGCGVSQVAMYNGAAWGCANAAVDTTLSEAEVEFFIENGPITLALGTTLNGSAISLGAHTVDTQLSEANVESMITNGVIDLFVGSLVNGAPISTGAHTVDTNTQLSEGTVEGYITNGSLNLAAGTTIGGAGISTGAHTVDTNTQLSDAAVDAFVENGPLDFAALSTLNGATISTGAHTVDTNLTNAEVDAFVVNGALNLAAGTTIAGATISTGGHTVDTNTQLSEGTVEGYITNGALNLNGATTIGGATISTGAHTVNTNTQLTNAEVDAFVVNGALNLAAGTTLAGATISTGAHTVDTNTQLSEATVEGYITNGSVNLAAGSTIDGNPIQGGAIYTRWGRNTCPATGAVTLYSGYAASGNYNHGGGISDLLCLTNAPTWADFNSGNQNGALLYGTEFQTSNYGLSSLANRHDYDATCSVCEQPAASNQIMIPGTQTCPAGWTQEYAGYLMGTHYQQASTHAVACVDAVPDQAGSAADQNGNLWYPTEAECGSLPCGPYIQDRELTCAVCTK